MRHPGSVPASGDYGQVGDVQPAVRVVQAIYEAFARRDIEGALAHIREDVVLVPGGTASLLNREEPYVGHEGVRRYFADVAELWDDLTLHAEDIRAVAEGVVVFGTAVGTVGGEPYEARAVWNWKIQDGLATSMRVNVLGR